MEIFIKNNLKSGKLARLIPSVADSKKEERATSALLACFRIIPGFAQRVLNEVGVPIHKSSTVTCFTEVVFKKLSNSNKRARPDGLIIVKTRNKIWTAIVESKVGNNSLTKEQIEEYLDIAKSNKVNALITISNQYATIPTHHPIQVNKQKLKSTDLFHFSWLFIQTIATLLSENKIVDDPEQAFILSEFIKYLEDPESGVTSFNQMGKGWREVATYINEGIKLKRNDLNLEDAISSWQQYSKYLSIKLSELVGQPVYEYISRSRTQDTKFNYEVRV